MWGMFAKRMDDLRIKISSRSFSSGHTRSWKEGVKKTKIFSVAFLALIEIFSYETFNFYCMTLQVFQKFIE